MGVAARRASSNCAFQLDDVGNHLVCALQDVRGECRIDRQAAHELGRHYLSEGEGRPYPAYDRFDTARAAGPLGDSDLLAPVLLNVRI